MAQLVARYLGVVEAASSSLVTQTNKKEILANLLFALYGRSFSGICAWLKRSGTLRGFREKDRCKVLLTTCKTIDADHMNKFGVERCCSGAFSLIMRCRFWNANEICPFRKFIKLVIISAFVMKVPSFYAESRITFQRDCKVFFEEIVCFFIFRLLFFECFLSIGKITRSKRIVHPPSHLPNLCLTIDESKTRNYQPRPCV